jgi:hypothetical protein
VVWRAVQEDFLRQMDEYKSLMERCYPGSSLAFEFTKDDLLRIFSDISRGA